MYLQKHPVPKDIVMAGKRDFLVQKRWDFVHCAGGYWRSPCD